MKLKTHSNRLRRSQAGFTLIEISLVIALILGLITVAFMGVGAYRKGSDEAKCKMQLAQVQKAVRSMANMKNMQIGVGLVKADVFGTGNFVEVEPECPAGGVITWLATVPAVGTPYGSCVWDAAGTYDHALPAAETVEW